MNDEAAKKLRAPFPPEAVGKLPKAGTTLDFVGHAEVTDRLLQVDPEWTWEPMAYADDGGPLIRSDGKVATLWIWLTVAGTRRPGVGNEAATKYDLEKLLISDALRNAAMRFGVALDLWKRGELDDRPGERGSTAPAGIDHRTGEIVPIDDVDALKPRELHDALSARGLDATGSVSAMRERLRQFAGTGEPQRGDGHVLDATIPVPSPAVAAASPVPETLPGVAATREDADRAGRGTSSTAATRDRLPAYSDMKRVELVALCGEREIDVPSNATVPRLIDELEAYDRRQSVDG